MSEGDGQILSASAHDVRNFAALLRGLSFASKATLSIHDAGLQLTAEDSRILLGTAYIPINTFDEFIFKPESTGDSAMSDSQASDTPPSSVFEIPLDALLECLNIFGSGAPVFALNNTNRKRWKNDNNSDDEGPSHGGGRRGRTVDLNSGGTRLEQYFPNANAEPRKTGMRMGYAGAGHPLTLILAEDASGPMTTCEITTFDPEPQIDIPFDNSNKVVWIILSSSTLRDALSEFDSSCDRLIVIAKPSTPGSKEAAVRLQASGTFGSAEIEYPNDPRVLETFECSKPIQFVYRLNHIHRAIKALQSSYKSSIRIDAEGLMSMQFLMNTTEGAFLEFRFVALEEET